MAESTLQSMNYESSSAKTLLDNINSCITRITTSHESAMNAWQTIAEECFTGTELVSALKKVRFDVDVKKICEEIRKVCASIVNIDASWKDSSAQITQAVNNYVNSTTGATEEGQN